jgi:hypothetical protein
VRKPVRSFRDLEVYQKALEGAVMVAKNFLPILEKVQYPLKEEMVRTSLEIPRFIAEAHSRRFDSNIEGIALLEKAMTDCNKMIVYLEQVRDIYPENIERILCEELIKKYMYNRVKILNLSKAWKKWAEEDKK